MIELENGWVIYGGDWCGICRKAKKMLSESTKIGYFKWIDVPKDDTREKLKDELKELTGNHRTFPMIFHNKKFVGGYDKLGEYLLTVPDKHMVGGLSQSKPVDAELKKACVENINNDLKKQMVKDGKLDRFEEAFVFEPFDFRTQVVNGINYFVRCCVDEKNDLHLKLHKSPGSGSYDFVSYKYPIVPGEPLEYF